MMNKKELELEVLNIFSDIYSFQTGKKVTVREHRDKPDFEVKIGDDEIVGLEVTHVSSGQKEADLTFRPSEPEAIPVSVNSIKKNLFKKIEEKNNKAKKYNYDRKIWLLIRIVTPIFTKKDYGPFNALQPFDSLEKVFTIIPREGFNKYDLVAL